MAQITANKTLVAPARWQVCLAGLAGELGELFELYKKHLGHGHALDQEKLVKEAGDFLWYIAEASTHLRASLTISEGYMHTRTAYARLWSMHRDVSRLSKHFDCTYGGSDPGRTSHVYESEASFALSSLWASYQDFVYAAGLDLQVVMQTNIDKLRERYPDGFSEHASLNRKENSHAE